MIIVLSITGPALARDTVCLQSAGCRGEITMSSGGTVKFYRSLPLVRNDSVQRVVLIIHGNKRDADHYFDSAVSVARTEHRLGDVLVLAPAFPTPRDHPAPGDHYWSSGGWKMGNRSLDAKRISSFSVIDELLALLCPAEPGLFPQISTVVIIGHSAGAQFVGRYAAGGRGCASRSVEVRYVVMNPSSYLYLDGRRKSSSTGRFAFPDAGCRRYDDYKYGLRKLNAYLRRVGDEQISAQLFARHTYFVAGDADTRTDSSLDTRCEARVQGPNRLARFLNYREYSLLFPDWSGSEFITVPGIGHDARAMLLSDAVRRITYH